MERFTSVVSSEDMNEKEHIENGRSPKSMESTVKQTIKLSYYYRRTRGIRPANVQKTGKKLL
jgi:hypothetical protein